LLGSILSTKPLLSLKDGEVVPVGRTRSLPRAIDKIFDFAMGSSNVRDIAVMYSTASEGAETLAARLAPAFPDVHITIGQIGPVLGTHGGPDIVLVCIRGDVPASF